jgi:hypothetical protein
MSEAKPLFAVWTATLGSIGISLSQVSTFVQIAAGLAALAFTIWQWRRAKKKADREDTKL